MIITWLGVDQSGWDLTTGAQGVKLLGGIRGFDDPDFVAFWTERIGDGDRWRGSRLTRREVTLRIMVGTGETGMDWRELDRAWWKSVSRDNVGLLDVVLEDTTHRYIPLRLAKATQSEIDFDPALTGYRLYLVTLVADDPYFRGDDITETWMFTTAGEDFYGGSGGGGLGPPYYISPSGDFGEAMVTNPGDVPAWPRWRVTGPNSGAMLTVDGHSIAVPVALPALGSIYVHTEPPDVFGDFLESRWDAMTGVFDPVGVPVGATVPVTAQVTGPGSGAQVTMTITPRYERAW